MRRLLLWLLVPVLPVTVVLGILTLQDGPSPAHAVAPVEGLPPLQEAPAAKPWSFALLRSDGSAASDGVVIVLEPAVTSTTIGADGVCRFTLRSDDPVQVLAWAPGHRVREAGPWESPPLELRLDALEALPSAVPPLELMHLRLQIVLEDGETLPGALMLARPEASPEAPPWLAFADANGIVECEVENTPLLLEIYAPGRAPQAAWLLANETRLPGAVDSEWMIVPARLEISGFPAMEPVQLRRDGELLDLIAASEAGVALWQALSPGAWEVSTATGRMRLILEAGTRRVSWVPDQNP